MLRLIPSLTALALIATPVIAQSAVNDGAPTAKVRYDDLNLNTAAGVEALNRRVSEAANEMCGDYDRHELARSALGQACYAKALASARPQISQLVAQTGTIRVAVRPPIRMRGGE